MDRQEAAATRQPKILDIAVPFLSLFPTRRCPNKFSAVFLNLPRHANDRIPGQSIVSCRQNCSNRVPYASIQPSRTPDGRLGLQDDAHKMSLAWTLHLPPRAYHLLCWIPSVELCKHLPRTLLPLDRAVQRPITSRDRYDPSLTQRTPRNNTYYNSDCFFVEMGSEGNPEKRKSSGSTGQSRKVLCSTRQFIDEQYLLTPI